MDHLISVLHIDDEITFLELIKRYMKGVGNNELTIYSLTDPFQVFEVLESHSIDVIITDYQMPGMDGLELLQQLRTQNNTIPVIFLTGRGREEVAIQALNLGANHYLEKRGEIKMLCGELYHIIRQVVHHEQMERALIESEERYRIIFNESPVSLWEEDFSLVKQYFQSLKAQSVSDLRRYLEQNPEEVAKLSKMVRIINVNNTTLKLYNARTKEEFYAGLPAFFNDQALELFKEELNALFNGETVYQSEFPGYKLTGEMIDVIVRLSVIPGYEDTLEKVIVSVIDITDQKQVENTLRRQKEELSEFAHFISHDINNCLTLIEGYIGLLDLDYDASTIIDHQVDYMKRLMSRSLMLADAGLSIEKNAVVDLNHLVKRVAKVTIPKTISFLVQPLPSVLCDEERLAQVFKNLFENAVIHGIPNKISVQSVNDDEGVFILILNDGTPIPQEIQNQIFDYGFSTSKDSMGLGLPIVKKIIEAHGWKIAVHSNSERTLFQIKIPMI